MIPKLSIESILHDKLAQRFSRRSPVHLRPVSGGSINQCYQVQYGDQAFFCKVNSASNFPHLFQTEQRGLQSIAKHHIFLTPPVVDCFSVDGYQFLLLEWIEEGNRTPTFWRLFGEQLAALHQVSDGAHGWDEDNYMGSVPQRNSRQPSWCLFFAKERLSPLVKRCANDGLLNKNHLASFSLLEQRLPLFFPDEPPALLHGDLWSGNFICNASSLPVLIDPAVYFGHRSMDLGMTTLFGGFPREFYDAYHYHFPLPANSQEQWSLCNLYPLLIHLYLFGTSYLPQIERTLKKFHV